MKLGKYDYNRCTKSLVCPICGKSKWCMVSCDGCWALCTSITEGSVRKYTTGYLHDLSASGKATRPLKSNPVRSKGSSAEFISRFLERNISSLEPLALKLGVTLSALGQLEAGKLPGKNAWAFPMRDENRKIIGLKCRNLEGRKWCTTGSRLGLYIPLPWPFPPFGSPIFIAEGESDTAACLSIGLFTIGRPSVSAGGEILCRYVGTERPVYLFADTDKTGIGLEEARKLKKRLHPASKIIYNPAYKDVREWILSGTFSKILNLGGCIIE